MFVELLEYGADKIWRLVNDGALGRFNVLGQKTIDVAPGNGPGHIAIRGMLHIESHLKRPSRVNLDNILMTSYSNLQRRLPIMEHVSD